MRETRHPHPHIDPRQPRNGSKPGTNPPVFVWRGPEPAAGTARFRLTVARDEKFADVCLDESGLADPVYLPQKAFEAGRYFWRWSQGAAKGEVFTFEITPGSVALEVPGAAEWLRRLPAAHPRIYIRGEELEGWRRSLEGLGEKRPAAVAAAEALLGEKQEMAEPPFLPDWHADYRKAYDIWAKVLWESRAFVRGAETLALAYLLTGEKKYGRAAAERMASVSKWDPDGSSHISHNDEAHMSVIWHGPAACDWVWEEFTDREREAVVAQFRRRGRITYEHMHDRGLYGVRHFGSHAGREIVFLAMIALVFHEEIPEAAEWLDWLRPVLCGIWPVWAGDDGGWAEGPSYGLAYVGIMAMFATALKRGAGIDLYRRPFWRNHAAWRKWCLPPYAEWMGFGDHSEPWESTWVANANLVELIARETSAGEFERYISELRRYAPRFPTPEKRKSRHVEVLSFFARDKDGWKEASATPGIHRVFPAVGWAAIRTDIEDASNDVAFIFRSSPFGAISHSHANNNDFIIHVAGSVVAMPSGYYVGYGSAHHAHWVWHTMAHNCITLSGAGQIMRSHDSTGAVENAFEDGRVVYLRGTADASYADRARRCRRHVIFLKGSKALVLIDEFVAVPAVPSAVEWNIHSFNAFRVDEERRSFLVERDGSSLEGTFLWHDDSFFSLSEGWDPPPMDVAGRDNQYHLRFTALGLFERMNLAVVLRAGHGSLERAPVATERGEGAEIARIGGDTVAVGRGGAIDCNGRSREALAVAVVGGTVYEITDEGVSAGLS